MFLAKEWQHGPARALRQPSNKQPLYMITSNSLVFPVGLPSGSLQSFDAFQSDSVQICFWIFEALLVSRAGEAANWRNFIAKSEDGPGPVHWHQYIHTCCLKLLIWRKVPTEPQQEGQRFTLQDGHLAMPRIQDWKSWQLQSLHFTHGDMVHYKS